MPKKKKVDRIAIARKAGRVKSEVKAAAARENGKKGGRPGNPEIRAIMTKRGVTRQRAHQILHGK